VSFDRALARGPARLTVALGIGLGDDGLDLARPPFALTLPDRPAQYLTGPGTGPAGRAG